MRHVQSVINSISNVEVWANGATGLLNANSLNSLKTAVSGLSKEQALLVLSTKNLTQAQTEQVLVEAGIIASNDKINASIVQRALAESTLTAEQQKDILTKLELVNVETGEVITTNACTKAALEEALAKKGIVGADAEAIISSMGLTSANATQTISFDLLTASIWANIKALGKWLVTKPIGWAILGGTAIFGLVKAYDALTDSTEEVKERTDALLDSYNSAISEANSNAKTIESLASRYETLSKGVNSLGENVSLTADEYSEYNDIVNQIAEMFPTMITGYTDEGNAILSLKGNVEELRDAYKEAQKEAYNLLIVSGKDSDGNDIITNYQNQLYGNESFLSTTSSYIDGEAGAKDAIDVITRLTGALTPDEFRETYNQLYEEYKNIWNSDKIQDALKSSGFEELTHAPKWSEITTEDLVNVKYSAQATIQTYQAEIDSQLQNVRTLANAYLMTNSDYEKLDEQSKTAASLLVNSIDESIANGFKNKSDVGAYVAELITSISNSTEAQKALTKLFTMDTTNMLVGEIQSEVDSYVSTIATAIGEDPVELKVRLGFDYVDELEEQYQRAVDYAKDKFKSEPIDITPYQEVLDDEYQKIQDWGLEDYADKIKNSTIQSVFGNVDMDKRTIITWSDELKQTYADALASWNYDPEIGSIDTVFGGSSRFGEELNGVGWEVAFTPILPDGTFLSQDTVYDYINTILEEAYADDGKVTEDELVKIDAQGRQIGNTFVHGIFAGIDDSQNYDNNGNWDETVGRLMHFSGDFGAVQIAKDAIEKAKKQEADFDWDSWFKENSINTQEEIDRWNEIAQSATNAADAIKNFKESAESIPEITFNINTDKIKDGIDSYQSSLSTITEKMADVATLSSSDIIDMMQEFSKFDWSAYGVMGKAGVGRLDEALRDLIKEQKEQIISTLSAAGATEEMISAFSNMADSAISNVDYIGATCDKLSDLASAYKTVETALTEYAETGYMSIDNATAMLNLSDAYLAALVNEQGQVTLEADAYRVLMDTRLDEAEAKATQQALTDIASITNETTALSYLTQNNYAVASSLYEKANAYAQVEAAARKALAAEGAGQYTQQAVSGIMNAYKSRMAVIQATRNSVSKSIPNTLSGSGSSPGGSGTTGTTSKPSSKELDWFEYRIKELDEEIELTKTHLDNLTGSSAKNTLVGTLEGIYTTKQSDLKQGIDMYTQYAEQELAKIPEQFRAAAQNGALGITDFIGDGNDDVVEAIENYRNFAEKVGDLENEVAELDATIRQLQVDKFKNIADDYEKLINLTDNYRDKTQAIIDLEENYGNKVGVGFYDTLIDQTQQKKKLLEEEYQNLSDNLQNAIATGKIKLGSDEWKEMHDTLVDVDSELIECASDIEDFVNAKLELKVKEFEEIQDALDGINNSLETYINLLENDSVTTGDTTLNFTDEALTQLGLLGQQYDLASEKVETYGKRMEELKRSYDSGELSITEYREQLMELLDSQNSSAESMYSAKEAMLDLIKNGIDEVCDAIDEETEAYNKLIDKKKEALEQDKNEADFQKELAEKNKTITDIQRQIAALGSADDSESNARRKSLNSQLIDAQNERDEFLADHSYDIQTDALDKEAEAYEQANEDKKQALQDSLNDEEAIIAKYLQEVVTNHETVYTTLQELGLVYGINLETSITEPWRVSEDALGQYAVSFGNHSSIFITQLQGIEGEIYNVQTQANNMAMSMINAMGVSSAGLVGQVNNVASALNNDVNYAQYLGNMLYSVLSANYNTSGITSSLYSVKDAANSAASAVGSLMGALSGNTSRGYYAVYTGSGSYSSEKFATEAEANAWVAKANAGSNSGHKWVVRKYAKGGLVKRDKNNPYNSVAESVGEDTFVAVQEGEYVLDKYTTDKFIDLMDVLKQYPQMSPAKLLSPTSMNSSVLPSIRTPNMVNQIENKVIIHGNVSDNNVKLIQKQIDDSISKYSKQLLGKVRYS